LQPCPLVVRVDNSLRRDFFADWLKARQFHASLRLGSALPVNCSDQWQAALEG